MRPRRISRQAHQAGRMLHKLNQKTLATLGEGIYSDGGNLYFRVRPGHAPKWLFIYEDNGIRTELTLGSAHEITLTQAREMAREYREARKAGEDPAVVRDERRRALVAERRAVREARMDERVTLARCAREYHAGIEHGFKNPKEARRWINALEMHVPAKVLLAPIATVEASALLEFLEPLFRDKRETAKDVRQRLELVFSWSILKKRCSRNPAAEIRAHLKKIKPRVRPSHFASLPWPEVPAFYAQLRAKDGIAARAAEFTLLCAARTGETLGMTWDEYRPRTATWVVAEARMKGERGQDDTSEPRDHTVFLSPRAVEIVESMRGLHPRLVFPSPEERKRSGDERLSNGAMLAVIDQLGFAAKTTMHGFRSSFRTWARERGYDQDLAEAVLAHRERDAIRAAYDRVRSQPVDDPMALFTRMRRQILIDWHDFVAGVRRDNVARLEQKRRGNSEAVKSKSV